MRIHRKLYGSRPGKTPCEATRFKQLWRDVLTEDEKAEWEAKFISPDCQPLQIVDQIRDKYQINLRTSAALKRFRDWVAEQQELDEEEERQRAEQARVLRENPGMTIDEAREVVLIKAYNRAIVTGNFKLGLAVVRQDLSARNFLLALEKAQFDAAKAALVRAPELKAISTSKLTDVEKIQAARVALFGNALPEEDPEKSK
jgi:hypothetical protein